MSSAHSTEVLSCYFVTVPLFIAEKKTAWEWVPISQFHASRVNLKFQFQASFRLGHTGNIFLLLLLLLLHAFEVMKLLQLKYWCIPTGFPFPSLFLFPILSPPPPVHRLLQKTGCSILGQSDNHTQRKAQCPPKREK